MSTQVNEAPAAVLGPRMKQFFRHKPDNTIHQFLAFQVKDEEVTYSTSRAIFTCTTATLAAEMHSWLPATDVEIRAIRPGQVATTAQVVPVLPAPIADGFASMFETLKFAIDKVKENPDFVPQANAINNLAKSQIAVVQTQLSAYKMLGGSDASR